MFHDAILEDEEQMKGINQALEKLKSGLCTKSIRDDSINMATVTMSHHTSQRKAVPHVDVAT